MLQVYDVFSSFCISAPKTIASVNKRTNKTYYMLEINTRSSPCFNYYRDLFYPEGVKVVPPNIGELLTAEGLAFWLMDDGYRDRNALRISTESFTKEEVLLLIQALKENFQIHATIQDSSAVNRYRIYIKVSSMERLRTLVVPYFNPSMLYKLGL